MDPYELSFIILWALGFLPENIFRRIIFLDKHEVAIVILGQQWKYDGVEWIIPNSLPVVLGALRVQLENHYTITVRNAEGLGFHRIRFAWYRCFQCGKHAVRIWSAVPNFIAIW